MLIVVSGRISAASLRITLSILTMDKASMPKYNPKMPFPIGGISAQHDGLSRQGRRIPTSSVRLAMGKQTNAQSAWFAADIASPHHRPSCSNRVLDPPHTHRQTDHGTLVIIDCILCYE